MATIWTTVVLAIWLMSVLQSGADSVDMIRNPPSAARMQLAESMPVSHGDLQGCWRGGEGPILSPHVAETDARGYDFHLCAEGKSNVLENVGL